MNLDGLFEGVAATRGERVFLTWPDGGRATYADVARAVAEQARVLADAGWEGRRLAIMAANRPELVVLWLGALRAGATPLFVNRGLTSTELEPILADLGVGLVFHDAEAGAVAARPLALADTPSLAVTPVPAGLAAPDPAGDRDSGAILLTSGSIGRPKYVGVPHAGYVLKGVLNALRLQLGPGDRSYCAMPLFHVGAQCETLCTLMAAGGSIHLAGDFSATSFWDDLRAAGATHVHATGALLAMALARAEPAGDSKLTTIVASLRDELAADLRRTVPSADLITLYGLTECPLGTLAARGEEYRSGWVGYPYEAAGALRVADPDGRPLPDGEPGEIQLRNAACAREYLAAGEREAGPLTADGWVRSGDVGVRADGGLYLVGRIKEMIRRSGENISPVEVEDALLRHPLVTEAAVVGHPDLIRDEEVRAFVQTAPGREVDPAELRDFASSALARYKVPRYVDVLERLPRTASNKIDKPALAERHPEPRWDAER